MCNPGTDCKWCGRKIETCERVRRAFPTDAEERAEAVGKCGNHTHKPALAKCKITIGAAANPHWCVQCHAAPRYGKRRYCRQCLTLQQRDYRRVRGKKTWGA